MTSIKKTHAFNEKPEDSMKQSFYSDQQHNQLNLDTNQINQFIQIKTTATIVSKRAHHSACLGANNQMYVYGGYEAGGAGILEDFLMFDVNNKKWELIAKKNLPGARHSHSMILWNNKLILFGGVISTLQATNTIFQYDVSSTQGWKQLKFTNPLDPSVHLPYINSHKAILSNSNTMLIFSGQTQQKYSTQIYKFDLLKSQTKWFHTSTGLFSESFSIKSVYIWWQDIRERLNELWCYDILNNQYNKIQYSQNDLLIPYERSDHSAGLYEDCLVVFAGSSGVTHQRNDLLYYHLVQHKWYQYWPDHSENHKFTTVSIRQSTQKKSRSNSVKKLGNSLVSKNGQSHNNDRFKNESQINQKSTQQCQRKYRRTMKNENYYNQNYPFYGQRVFTEEQTQKERFIGGYRKIGSSIEEKIPLNLSQTFQSLNHSIIINNSNSKNESLATSSQNFPAKKDQRQKDSSLALKYPKPRDGHSCQIYDDMMIIFGGDRHHMSYNDILLIDLSKVMPQKQCVQRNKEKIQGEERKQDNQNGEEIDVVNQNNHKEISINKNDNKCNDGQKEKQDQFGNKQNNSL